MALGDRETEGSAPLIKRFLIIEDPNKEKTSGVDGLEIVGMFPSRDACMRHIRFLHGDAVESWGDSEGFKLGKDPDFSSHYRIYEFCAEIIPEVEIVARKSYRTGEVGSG